MIFPFDIYSLVLYFVVIFLASFAIPTGALFIIVSFAAVTISKLDLGLLFLITLLATVSGDYLAYALARYFSRRFNLAIERVAWLKERKAKADKLFDEYGQHTVFLTRFLFSAIGPYVNFFSGLEAMPIRSFMLAVISGEVIYCAIYIAIGYVFSDTWQVVATIVKNYTAFTMLILLGLFVLYRLFNILRHNKKAK